MFGRKLFEKRIKKVKPSEYKVESENLAVPEIHTGEVDENHEEPEDERMEEPITYENVAIPEIHIKKRKK